jgi:hypothetical protein
VQFSTWQPNFLTISPAYHIFSWLPQEFLDKPTWPSLAEYNHLPLAFDQPTLNLHDQPICFVDQNNLTSQGYEPTIFLTGQVPTRGTNWHDFFNMLIWYTFPKIKAMLNACQYHSISQRAHPTDKRSPLENFLTLFDENGIIVASSNDGLLDLVKEMHWKTLFWQQRKELYQQLKCFIVGHSLHEKLLKPYIGMVGHSLLLKVDPHFFSQDLANQILHIQNQFLAMEITTLTTQSLFPIPILGLPDWHPDTNHASFYDNKNYFRSKKGIADSL